MSSLVVMSEGVQRLQLDVICDYATLSDAPKRARDVLTSARRMRGTLSECLPSLPAESIDIVHLDIAHLADMNSETVRTLLERVSQRGVMMISGTRSERMTEEASRILASMVPRYRSIEFVHASGLRMFAIGGSLSHTVEQLFSYTKTREERMVLRNMFEHLGRGLSAKGAAGGSVTHEDPPRNQAEVAPTLAAVCTSLKSGQGDRDPTGLRDSERKTLREENLRLQKAWTEMRNRVEALEEDLTKLSALVIEKQALIDRCSKRPPASSNKKPTQFDFKRVARWFKPSATRKTSNLSAAVRLIESSEFFDSAWYARTYLGNEKMQRKSAYHYLTTGATLGFNPSQKFNTNFYLENNPDVRDSSLNPLVHFLRFGQAENRKINSL